jgi:hypothetical protein
LKIKIYKSTFLLWTALIVSTAAILGCGKSQEPAAPAAPAAPAESQLKIQPGFEYVYYRDGSCKEDDGRECIDGKMVVDLCSKNPGISIHAANGLGLSNSQFGLLVESGFEKATYRTYETGERACEVVISASGLIRGTSRRITVVAEPNIFKINSDGKLVLHYASYLYEQ